MSLSLPPIEQTIEKLGQGIDLAWAEWFTQVFEAVFSGQQSGATAQRPTQKLWVGRRYFDTTLGKPVWVKSLKPTVWVDGAGTTV